MAFPNANVTDVLATTIMNISADLSDNMLGNNGLFTYLSKAGRIRSIDGGYSIVERLIWRENPNASWYSGADFLGLGASEDESGASFSFAQAAVPVAIVGRDKLINAGKEKIHDLVKDKLMVADKTMQNLLAGAAYSDGTGFGGKEMTGITAAVPVNPLTGVYGGINRGTAGNEFWRTRIVAPGAGVITAANINSYMNDMWVQCVRGKEYPGLIVSGDNMWKLYAAFLQERQRFASAETAGLGFPTMKFNRADLILDGGIAGDSSAGIDTNTMVFLNLDYLSLRPHRDRNMVPLNPGRRYAVNQDVEAQILVWAGNITMSGGRFHGRLHNNA